MIGMRRRSVLPPPTSSGQVFDPRPPPKNSLFWFLSPAPRVHRPRPRIEEAEGEEVLDISSSHTPSEPADRETREVEEEKERRKLREEAARSLGWGPEDAGAGVAVVEEGSFLKMGEVEEEKAKSRSKRQSIQALFLPSRSPVPAPSPSPGPVPSSTSTTNSQRIRSPDPVPPFPSPLGAFTTLYSSSILFPPAPGFFGFRKPRPRLLLLSPQGSLHLFPGRFPTQKEKEISRLSLHPGGNISAILLEGGRMKQQEHMLRVEGLSPDGMRETWVFACLSKQEMGEWIRVVERFLEGGSLLLPAAAGGRLKQDIPSPAVSYPSAFAPLSPSIPEASEPVSQSPPTPPRVPADYPPMPHPPVTALPFAPKPSPRPSTDPSKHKSFIAGPPTIDPNRRRPPVVPSPSLPSHPESHTQDLGQLAQLGQHPFGASSTSLRDREIRESLPPLPPPRRPRPGSISGRPLSPSPSTSSDPFSSSPLPSLPAAPKESHISTSTHTHSPRRRTPKRPSTAPSLGSPSGTSSPLPPLPLLPTNSGSLKRRSGTLPPLSPPPNHPIPALPTEPPLVERKKPERRVSAFAALPGPPTTNGTGGYINGTRSRPGSVSSRTVRLLPDIPAQELVGLGISSPNLQRRMTPPPRPPPTTALPALPVNQPALESERPGGLSTRERRKVQRHWSMPATTTMAEGPFALTYSQGENIVGDSLGVTSEPVEDTLRPLRETNRTRSTATLADSGEKISSDTSRKMGESFFDHSPELDQEEFGEKPPRASSVLLGDDADRFWNDATVSNRPGSEIEKGVSGGVSGERCEHPRQDSVEMASTSTKTSFEVQPVSYGTEFERLEMQPAKSSETVTE
ncbi:hypothetical protein DACRYDRAFT_118423 [Dacryopinax primogenitus]|uniref:PH domain-containing protein n=1 Tax=Dacryopinax primogenitus (strain DJM 731) TaxID=1858805 RepID=M5FS30_DACPD|nr:uncharacterized protein DACRYDRAFT_118423 [Dacryopinax primogenitus]EJT98588.1 hypothetical protein DACRYDRAFT_118423 [Dacryopinax primogenitus]